MMHPITKAALLAAIGAELAADPAQRGYDGRTATEIAALMAAPVPQPAPPPEARVLTWGEARGIAQSHGCWPMIVLRARGTPANPPVEPEDWAILAAINAVGTERDQRVNAGDPAEWGAFTAGVAAFEAVGDLTAAASAAILALGSHQPATPPDAPSRWSIVIDGISAAPTPAEPVSLDANGDVVSHPGNAGPPNRPEVALIQEALDGFR